jgi:hypothetical protein
LKLKEKGAFEKETKRGSKQKPKKEDGNDQKDNGVFLVPGRQRRMPLPLLLLPLLLLLLPLPLPLLLLLPLPGALVIGVGMSLRRPVALV